MKKSLREEVYLFDFYDLDHKVSIVGRLMRTPTLESFAG